MEKQSLLEIFSQTNEYRKMVPKQRVQLQKKRLYDLVMYAKDKSPLYAGHYLGLKDNFTLRDIPTIDKAIIKEHYDDWATDIDINLDSINDYLANKTDDNSLYLDKYHVVSGSGTEGDPLINLFDSNYGKIASAQYVFRCFARREHFWSFLVKGQRVANIYTENGSFFFNEFVNMRKRYLPFRRNKSLMLQAQSSSESLVEALNEFNPTMLAGFPSVLSRMADEKMAGRLKINPVFIMADGEPLELETRKKLEQAFNCDVTSSYSTAITGVIAYECREHHLHINDDWILLEAVDIEGNPVKAGKESDKVLVTNLLSYTQPVIRYELLDRITIHKKPCLCGNHSPWIEIAGRSMDTLRVTAGGREVIMPISDIDAVLKGVDYLSSYQIIIYPNTHLALRLTGAEGIDKTMAFFKAEKELRAYLKSIGIVAPMITLDKEDPMPHPLSGKYQTVIVE